MRVRYPAIFAMLVAIGCHGSASKPSAAVGNHGRVVGPDGEPVAGVIVTISDPTTGQPIERAVTDSHGGFVLQAEPGKYAVAAASMVGWYWVSQLEIAHEPLTIRFSSDCTRYAGRVAAQSNNEELDTAHILFTRVSMEYGDRFAIPLHRDGLFEACLPDGDYVAMVEGPFLSIPELVPRPSGAKLEIAAFSRESVLEAAPEVSAAEPGLDVPAFVSAIPEQATLVAIGEANHGSRSFLEWRRELSVELIRSRGFRVVLIEAGYGETLPLDRYLQGEVVDIRKAVERLGYWMWDTEEFLGVLEGLRAYNDRTAPLDRVHLWGMDVQDTAGSVDAILASHDLSQNEASLLQRLGPDRGEAWKAMASAERSTINSALDRIERSTKTTVALASLALRYRLEATTSSVAQLVTHRDQGMADIAIAVSKVAPDEKVILWAHDLHVAREPADGYPMMGEILGKRAGDAYFPIALFQAGGRARAWDEPYAIGVIPHEIPSPQPYQVERALLNATAGKGGFVIPSRLSPALQEWLSTPRYSRQFGANLRSDMPLHTPTKAYAAFGIIPLGSPTTPTATGIRKAKR